MNFIMNKQITWVLQHFVFVGVYHKIGSLHSFFSPYKYITSKPHVSHLFIFNMQTQVDWQPLGFELYMIWVFKLIRLVWIGSEQDFIQALDIARFAELHG